MNEIVTRRVAGYHDIRMDGMTDLVIRGRGKSVFDVGCNRGLVAFEFANNGATYCAGCDNFAPGIQTARELFADLRSVESQFEVCDLTQGPSSLAPFGGRNYDITVMLATYHKLKRIMDRDKLSELMRYLGGHTIKYFGWRATSGGPEEKTKENEEELVAVHADMQRCGMTRRLHVSHLSSELGVCAIWERG